MAKNINPSKVIYSNLGDTPNDADPKDHLKLQASAQELEQETKDDSYETDDLHTDKIDKNDLENGDNTFWGQNAKYIISGLVLIGFTGLVYLYNKMDQMENKMHEMESKMHQMEKRLDVIQRNQASPVPPGTVAIWTKNNKIPSGWRLCDGNDGTDNLVGKGIFGGGTWKDSRKVPYDCAVSFDQQQTNRPVRFMQKE